MPQPSSNAPEFSVSELSASIKRALEEGFGQVRVRGEMGRITLARSGHVYVDLKDANAVLSAVMWKGVAAGLRFKLEEGLEVIATGKISSFPGSSKYQLIIDRIEPAGIGALLAQLEERRKRLAAEGLFAPERKQALPFLPRVIGVVTSPTGAVIRDILHRLSDRFPVHVLLWPVLVQGDKAAEQVARAIAGFNAIPKGGEVPRPDLLIVARGGGSIEDLWAFNEEIVVRAAAASTIPLISAIGHETDTTLIDFAADQRAPTPTGAAEMAVRVRTELLERMSLLGDRLTRALLRHVERHRQDLRVVAARLPRPDALLAAPRQRLDMMDARLIPARRTLLLSKGHQLTTLGTRLRRESLLQDLTRRTIALNALDTRMRAAHRRSLDQAKDALALNQRALTALTQRLHTAILHDIEKRVSALTTLNSRLIPARRTLLLSKAHQLTTLGTRLRRESLLQDLTRRTIALNALDTRMRAAHRRSLEQAKEALAHNQRALTALTQRLHSATHQSLTRATTRLGAQASLLEAYSYKATLARGFALVRTGTGQVVRSKGDVKAKSVLTLSLQDGDVTVQALPNAPIQGTLF